ncbi:uncharacterized protein MKK02DRAFT_41949 [Dioszegia hungarica]|uniref:Uncharacterized protein n=1 Tax=Dioszegia hungarica TaxID=4972 RepID=A0AA38HGD1_9TREE|nr:uncharacterized protein MKK02DRAFT_41949 [Dioszegia hungarica]KAI9638921.1 hypothetical protein MKK02DRAFT_41949 [Dioszegia hungarica]
MIDAVTAARLYQVPSVYRVLSDTTRAPGADNAYLTYAIWALAGMPFRVAEAAKATLAYPIAFADKYIVDTLKELVPAEWTRLLEFHLRRIAGIRRVHAGKWLRDSTEYHLAHEYTESSQPHLKPEWTACSEPCMELDALIGGMYAKADSMEEIVAVKKRDYGLECSACIDCASRWYDKAVDELVEFAGEY